MVLSCLTYSSADVCALALAGVQAGRWYSHTPGNSTPKDSHIPCWRLRFDAGQSPLTVLAQQSYCTLYRAAASPSITRRQKNQVPHPPFSGLYVRLDLVSHSHSRDLASAGASPYCLAV